MNWFRALIAVTSIVVFATSAHAAGVLHRANKYEPATLDPQKINTQYENAIVDDLFEGLLTYDADGHPTLGVADSWQVTSDGLRYTFGIRAGLTWSDGTPLDANSVVASFRRLLDPATAARFAQLMYVIKDARLVNTGAAPVTQLGVAALDARTVQITLEAPTAYFTELLANPFASIVPVRAIAANGDAWTRPGVMVSNGPFTLKTWARDERIELTRNPRFHDAGSVSLDEVIYYPTEDSTSALARYKSGEFDSLVDFPPIQVDALTEAFGRQVHLDPALVTYYLAFNTSLKKFADPRVRRALSMAIDRDTITAKVLRTGDLPATSFVPPTTANYTPAQNDFTGHPMDERITTAKGLLKDAGYDEAHPLKVTLNYSNNQDFRRLSVVVAAMWKRAGVDTVLENAEGKVHFANLRAGNFEIGLAAWVADFDDASNFLYIAQSTSAGSNYSRYNNPQFDALMTKAAANPDPAARSALLHQAEAVMLKDQPLVPLYFGVFKDLVAPRVVGWRANPIDVHPSRYLSVEKSNG